MYRQDFHLQTLTCLAIAISPLCKLVPHWFGFCVGFLKNFIFYDLGVLFVAILEQTLMSILPGIRFGTMYPLEPSVLVWAGSKKPCSFNSTLVVTNPNFFAWVCVAVCTDKNSFFRHWQCLALPFPHFTGLFSHSCGKACEESEVRHLWHRQI